MKKLALFLLCLFSFSLYGQDTLSIESDFKLDPTLLDGLVLGELPDELVEIGMTQNPGVYTDKNIIKRLFVKSDVENILDAYSEVYVTTDEDYDDAGVIVLHFNSEESLFKNLSKLIDQSNLVYLIKDNYLIQVWSDVSGETTDFYIENMAKYYETKLNAKRYSVKK